jgi:DegV family protein with EDD domain
MSVRIVTDSTAHLAPGFVDQFGITVVPFHIQIDGRTYRDGVNLDMATFYSLVYEQGLQPKTSPPTVDEFYQVYQKLNQETATIISLHMSEALCRSAESARIAADMLLGRCEIVVIDSQSISVGLGILVEAAAQAAAQDQPLDEIVRLVRGLISQIYVVFFSETLDYLERGGRIGAAPALLGTMLGIKPFLTLEEGDIQPMEKVRTREEAVEKLVDFVSEFDIIRRIAVVKGPDTPLEEVDTLVEQVGEVFPELSVPVVDYGPVVAAHVGPDTLGVIVYEESAFE